MNLQEILARVRAKTGAASERRLARELGISQTAIRWLLAGHGSPSDETMLKIAAIIGLPNDEALLLVNMWRSRGQVRAIYAQMHKSLTTECRKENEGGKNRKRAMQSSGEQIAQ